MHALGFAAAAVVLALTGCRGVFNQDSAVDTTSVEHTPVKQQGISNCWSYAIASWLESLHLSATGEAVDLAESYLTYWRFHEQLSYQGEIREIATGFDFMRGMELAKKHGLLMQTDFFGSDGIDGGVREREARDYLNLQLQPGGTLSGARSNDLIMTELDKAFGVSMAVVQQKAIPISQFIVGPGNLNLETLVTSPSQQWHIQETMAMSDDGIKAEVDALLPRILRALNDHKPVPISFLVITTAVDVGEKSFKYDGISKTLDPSQFGGHLAVLTDYVVDDVPGIGSTEEGEASDEVKEKALLGKLRYLKIKNSWGTESVFGTKAPSDGYYRLYSDYLFKPLTNEILLEDRVINFRYVLLPPGY